MGHLLNCALVMDLFVCLFIDEREVVVPLIYKLMVDFCMCPDGMEPESLAHGDNALTN